MKKYLLIAVLIGTLSQCKKLEERDYFNLKGRALYSCNHGPVKEGYIEVKQKFKPKSGLFFLIQTDEEGYFEIPYKLAPEDPIILTKWGPKVGVDFIYDTFLSEIPPNKSIDLGEIYIRPYSHVYFKVTKSESGSTGDTLIISPGNIRLVTPFNDTLLGPFTMHRDNPSEFIHDKKMTSRSTVTRIINGIVEIKENRLWLPPCQTDTVYIASKM